MHLVVIGGGPAGYVGALRAARLGAKVTLVEEKEVGGTCLNVGCIPTKVLLHTVELFSQLKKARELGLKVQATELDWPQLQVRKQSIVRRLATGIRTLLKKAGVELVEGRGKLLGPGRVEVVTKDKDGNAVELRCDRVLLALGSRPVEPPIPGVRSEGVLYSDDALSLESLPKRLVIIGGGVVGVEMASIFHNAGSSVSVVEMMPEILPPADQELAGALRQLLARDGIRFYTSAQVTSIGAGDGGLEVVVRVGQREERLATDKVLVTVGRKPNTGGQGLEECGVQLEKGRIVVDDYLETSLPGVFAAGDVIGGAMLAHVAFHEGLIAAENAILGKHKKVDYRTVPTAIYTSPELAGVGLTESEARQRNLEFKVGRFPMVANGKALIENGGKGMVKVLCHERSGEILGVHILAPRATDMIAEAGLAIGMGATFAQVAGTIHPHPTVSEALAEACLAVEGQAIHLP
ncbi:MAG: dihydrolipoyl dehydrogenase [Bacillota bacterium]